MEFRILGPIEIKAHGARLDVGHLKQRTVLAALLVDAGRPVTQELLINRVWDGCPPANVRNTLYTYMARLRRILTSAPGAVSPSLVRRSGGYLLDVDPEAVDAHRFERLVAEAQAPGVNEERRFELASRALAQFSALPLTDLTCQWAARVREYFGRRRRDLLSVHAALAIGLGRADLVVDGLYASLLEEPLAEDLVGVLMSALYFSGRSAEALRLFASTRAAIAAELGVEPGLELRRAHEEILRGELARPALRALRQPSSSLGQQGVTQYAGKDRAAAPASSIRWARAPFHTERHEKTPEAMRAPGATEGAKRTETAPVTPVGAIVATVLTCVRPVGAVLELLPEPIGELAELYRGLLSEGKLVVVLDSTENATLLTRLLPAPATSTWTATDLAAGFREADSLSFHQTQPGQGAHVSHPVT